MNKIGYISRGIVVNIRDRMLFDIKSVDIKLNTVWRPAVSCLKWSFESDDRLKQEVSSQYAVLISISSLILYMFGCVCAC